MLDNKRGAALLEIFRQGLEFYAQQQAQNMLGNRLDYIGMSDIGRYQECPRATLAGKLSAANDSLEHLLTLQRGHWFEQGVGDTLATIGLNVLPQLEIQYEHDGVPIRAHLDFTLVWLEPQPAVRVLEVKSMGQLPETAYAAHELQVSGQTALLRHLWDKPAFSLRDLQGRVLRDRLTFPEICQKQFDLTMPDSPDKISLEGWLLCLSLKNAAAFGPYAGDSACLDGILATAQEFWTQLQAVQTGATTMDAIPYAEGFYPLCQYCQYNSDCPKFPQSDYQPQWQPALTKLEGLKQSRSSVDDSIKEIENALKLAYQRSGVKDWISTGEHRFRNIITAGRRTLNRDALHNEIAEVFRIKHVKDIDLEALFSRCEKVGVPSSRLTITATN